MTIKKLYDMIRECDAEAELSYGHCIRTRYSLLITMEADREEEAHIVRHYAGCTDVRCCEIALNIRSALPETMSLCSRGSITIHSDQLLPKGLELISYGDLAIHGNGGIPDYVRIRTSGDVWMNSITSLGKGVDISATGFIHLMNLKYLSEDLDLSTNEGFFIDSTGFSENDDIEFRYSDKCALGRGGQITTFTRNENDTESTQVSKEERTMTNGNAQDSHPPTPAKTGCRLGVDYYYGFAYGTLLGLMHRDDVGDEAKGVIQGALERLDQFEFCEQRA